jgi:signal transduction histidine kinase
VAGRLALAASVIFLLRLVLLAAAFLAAASLVDPLLTLPPLERAASILTLLLIVWAFAFPEPSRLADAATAALLLLALIAVGITWALWAQQVAAGAAFYNGTPQETGWVLAQIALAVGGMILLVARRRADWLVGLALLILLIGGHALHLVYTFEDTNVPGALRLMEIVALPLFGVMAYRRVHLPVIPAPAPAVEQGQVEAEAASDLATTAPLPEEPPVPEAARLRWALDPKAAVALASLQTATHPEEVGQTITLALAHTFRADLCLLITPPDASGAASVACAYDLIREKFLPGAVLPLHEMLAVDSALRRGEAAILNFDEHGEDLRRLALAAGFDHAGPALIVPLSGSDGALLGAVALLSPYAQREWSADDRTLLAAMLEPIAAVLQSADQVAQLNRELANQQAQAESAVAEMQAASERLTDELREARAEAAHLADKLVQWQMAAEQQPQEAPPQPGRLPEAAEAQQRALEEEVNNLRIQLQWALGAADERDRLALELQDAQVRVEAAAQLEAQFEQATRALETHQQRESELAAELERARAEGQARQAQLQAAASSDELEQLRTELQAARQRAEERDQLEAELKEATERLAGQSVLESRLEAAMRDVEERQQREAELRAELDRVREEWKAVQAQRPLLDDVERLRNELQIARTRIEDYKRLEVEHTEALKRLMGRAALEAKLEAARREVEAHQQREQELQVELERARAQVEAQAPQQAALERLAAQLEAARAQLAERDRRSNETQLELETLRQQEFQLRKELDLTRAELKRATEEAAALAPAREERAADAEALAEFKKQLEEKTRVLNAAQSALNTAQNEIASQAKSVAVMRELLAKKEQQLAQAQASLAALSEQVQPPSDLEGQPPERERQLAEALTAAQAQLAEQERQLAEAQAALQQAQATAAAPTDGGKPLAVVGAPSLEVIASLAQELRQPMSSIVGYSDLLLGESVGILGDLQRKFLERITASCERMEALLEDMIRVVSIDTGRLKLARDALDVMNVIEDAILSCGAQYREKGINLRLNIADDLPAVHGDRDALREIITHLLNNAGGASAIAGEVVLTVQRESEQPPGGEPISYLFVSVRDSGGGVAPEDQPRVFSRFYRADAPLIAGLGDTGVGLSIAKALVEAQGGRIWLTSEIGVGSTISLLLPVDDNHASARDNGSHPDPG